jgi:hypothetical protein
MTQSQLVLTIVDCDGETDEMEFDSMSIAIKAFWRMQLGVDCGDLSSIKLSVIRDPRIEIASYWAPPE